MGLVSRARVVGGFLALVSVEFGIFISKTKACFLQTSPTCVRREAGYDYSLQPGDPEPIIHLMNELASI